ncbi:mid region of cactin-domain-containing protein [Microdochium trichocladiopsis]|uniref:Splicing factor Cactin n=1 Tax=Microdochium trichocladiopsis TaxID=1682393 RepID=A0A9P8YAW9_9PEZI|nr:mid region of cactin-domain-containing protein [Microdochium trichocladiopsis]KAH7034689.1 mid region of cactin-domain-containing protein [Microdochium trichocladiopsis]
MDPGRQAMINGRRSPTRRDITSPRRDNSSRISKPPRPAQNKPLPGRAAAVGSYLSQDEQSRQYVADEDKFVLKQSKKKADIRVREGRAKPIDLLAFNLRYIDTNRDVFDDEDQDIEIDVPSPSAVIQKLREAELEELESEIASYHTLETSSRNAEYWSALKIICADRRRTLKPLGREERVVSSVSADVDKILGPKTLEQLEKLEGQIQAKLRSDEVLDTDYWEQLLKSLSIYKAKAKLERICATIKEARTKQLLERDPGLAEQMSSADTPAGGGAASGMVASASTSLSNVSRVSPAASGSSTTSSLQAKMALAAAQSASSPAPGTARFAATADEDFSSATKALYEREMARGISENEEIFTAEESVATGSKPVWANKYRPRKPRYFNRVQMGYEWNKYNQTHYDHDNPPPKVVQGYKFNIFYPDLIDKTKAPTFKIIREHGRRRGESFAPAGEEDTCLLRFIAGPPYEDIAFRIVDKEWDYSAKRERGFRSSFDKVRALMQFVVRGLYSGRCTASPLLEHRVARCSMSPRCELWPGLPPSLHWFITADLMPCRQFCG